MPLKVTFELSDKDLRHFRSLMREARATAKSVEEAEIIAGARQLLDKVESADLPEFARERLGKLRPMIGMLEDDEWRLVGADRQRVVSALAYFNEPQDLIPDHIPGFGFIDDAIMVQLVVEELRPEVEAFQDFCAYRTAEEKRRGRESGITRAEWVESKRRQLQGRMRRRRQTRARQARARPSGRSPFSLW